ncbi:hypothetical protein Nepgr_007543 [Nepenthes gracilis]|uniref:BCAS3 domain-containing protein n=1 Tax=Nepenthes gracilis TaxID=150966 RepID=A0AAD3S736_NEPGR|nr:hypothetical protein Nepgr_007543 [Nepenthes gracilis]
MRNDGHKQQGGVAGAVRANGFIPSSFRAISSYLRIVSSGASTVASSVRSAASAASSIVDRDDDAHHDQVLWAGFDKLECEEGAIRRVLLLGYRSGFQVWDAEEAHNVRDLVSRHDGPASFLQMLPKPIGTIMSGDKFSNSRPLLVVCSDGSVPLGSNFEYGMSSYNGSNTNYHDPGNGCFGPSVVRFYSLSSQSYVHVLKFRSVVYSVRCSARVVAVSQSAQIHCINAATLEREYTILTNPVVAAFPGSGGIGYGPLAVGPRWLAYSGSPVVVSSCGRVTPQHLTPSVSFPSPASNGSLVAHYAKESSKQLAAGIVTLGDKGYKKLSQYYSELRSDSNHSVQSSWKSNGTVHDNSLETDNAGMVIVRDLVSKSVIAQFRAHKSPILALCFDPSGTLLVTASVQGHNINVFRIMPGLLGSSSASDVGDSYVHLYRLQRGFTNAVIQDISFSDDSRWIMISSSRGTNHLFAISPLGGAVNLQFADANLKNSGLSCNSSSKLRWLPNSDCEMINQHSQLASGPPVSLSAVSRIRSGSNGWRGTVGGAAAAAAGRIIPLSGAIASSFHHCKSNDLHAHLSSLKAKYHLLVLSPSGCLIQYALRVSSGLESSAAVAGSGLVYESGTGNDSKLIVEAMQKWNICQKQTRREQEDNTDIYGENGNSDCKIIPEGSRKGNGVYPLDMYLVSKTNMSHEERHHLYISEAELQMHHKQIPFWAKSEIYFQSLMINNSKLAEQSYIGGEIEIERISTYTIEARSKNLVPVFDNFQHPKSERARVSSSNINFGPQLQRQLSGQHKHGGFSCRNGSCSLGSVPECGAAMCKLHHVSEQTMDSVLKTTDTVKGSVNKGDSPRTMSPPEWRINLKSNVMSLIRGSRHSFILLGEGSLTTC